MSTSYNRNRGMVTLLSAIVILVLISIMVIFAAKVGVFDQRMAANEARYKEAFATAEAGLDFAVQRFDNQFRATGAFTSIDDMPAIIAASGVNVATHPDGSAAAAFPSFTVAITGTASSFGGMGLPVYEFISTGTGADGTGTATIRRQLSMGQILGGGAPDVPVIVDGIIAPGGNVSIVANPNGGGPGVPVAIWTSTPGGSRSLNGSSATCHREFYVGNNPQCSNPSGKSELLSQGDGSTISIYDPAFPDILPNDPNFPSDLFQYLFGVARADWGIIKAQAENHNQTATDCNSLGVNSGEIFALWWIDGVCAISATQVIGSQAAPVILVIDDHLFKMNGGKPTIYGIVYVFNNPDNPTSPSGDLKGSPAIYGGLISDIGGNDFTVGGSLSIIHDQTLFENLTSEASRNYEMAYMPGSWRDY